MCETLALESSLKHFTELSCEAQYSECVEVQHAGKRSSAMQMVRAAILAVHVGCMRSQCAQIGQHSQYMFGDGCCQRRLHAFPMCQNLNVQPMPGLWHCEGCVTLLSMLCEFSHLI